MMKFLLTIRKLHWFIQLSIIFSVFGLVFLIVYILFVRILPPQQITDTKISGLILRNQIWQGTIRIDGDLVAFPGTNVTVQPGSRILISKIGDKLNLDLIPWHLKNGINTGPLDHGIKTGEPFWDEREKVQLHFWRLAINGTEMKPVILTSEGPFGSRYDINLISVRSGIFQYAQLSNYRRLEIGRQVQVINSSFENNGDCSICIATGQPEITKSTFRNSLRTYLDVGLASPLISQNKFLESNGDGILFFGNHNSNVRVFGNSFFMPSKKAIKVTSIDEGGVISGNLFTSGDIELPCDSKVNIRQNHINTKVIFDSQNCVGQYTFDANFWDIQNPEDVLRARIIGATKDFQIKIPTVLNKPPIND